MELRKLVELAEDSQLEELWILADIGEPKEGPEAEKGRFLVLPKEGRRDQRVEATRRRGGGRGT